MQLSELPFNTHSCFYYSLYNLANGTVISANQCTNLRHNTLAFFSMISCSKVTDSICYSLTRTSSGTIHTIVTQINFSSLGSIKTFDVDISSYITSTIAAVNDDEVIGSSFEFPTTYDHALYRYNFASDNYTWAVTSASLSK